MPWAACPVRLDTECVALLLYGRQLRLWLRDLARHQLCKLRHHLLREHGHLLHRWRKRTLVECRCLPYQQERNQHNHPAGVTRPIQQRKAFRVLCALGKCRGGGARTTANGRNERAETAHPRGGPSRLLVNSPGCIARCVGAKAVAGGVGDAFEIMACGLRSGAPIFKIYANYMFPPKQN